MADNSRSWEPRAHLETDGVMTAALLKYLGLPPTVSQPKVKDVFGLTIIPDMFSTIQQPLPKYTVQLVAEEKETADGFHELLKAMPKLRPNVVTLPVRLIQQWNSMAAAGAAPMDMSDATSSGGQDVPMTDANPKMVSADNMMICNEHKAPNLTIAVIHGDRSRERGKLSTAQGSQEPSIVLDHFIGSLVIILLQCFAGVDLLKVCVPSPRCHFL
jgi:hypothetical protein